MARKREATVMLPKYVQTVKRKRGGKVIKTDYYWAPGRGTKRAGQRVKIPYEPREPEFWAMAKRLESGETGPAKGTFEALIADYRGSPGWGCLRPATKADYEIYLDRILKAAGDRQVAELTKPAIYDWRNRMASTPVAANHQLSILQTIVEFAVESGYRDDNPVIGIRKLRIATKSARPWPENGYRFVLEHAPADLRRMAVLGRATGQRAGDLVRFGPRQRYQDGFKFKISKLGDKEHFLALTQAEIAEIDSWSVGPLDLYIKSPRNKPYTADHLNTRWNWWRGRPEADAIREEIMTIHGLRATAVCDRRMKGTDHQIIGDELGMSYDMVKRYSKHIDQANIARVGRDAREHEKNRI